MPAMFAARHYNKIAEVLKHSNPDRVDPCHAARLWADIVADMADEFQADNPKFDRDRFMAACHPAPIPMKA